MAKLKPNQFYTSFGALITEHPILFQTEMVQAILEGRKTQTRRTQGLEKMNEDSALWYRKGAEDTKLFTNGFKSVDRDREIGNYHPLFQFFNVIDQNPDHKYYVRPKDKPGDLFWTKETHKLGAWREDGRMAFDFKASPEITNTPWVQYTEEEDPDSEKFNKIWEKATSTLLDKGYQSGPDGLFHWEAGQSPLPWRPSIFLPKAASRIWLMLEEIYPERLQDISENDAKAEGIFRWTQTNLKSQPTHYRVYTDDDPEALYTSCPIDSFETLWSSINGKKSWDSNPWVWVRKFRVISREARPSMEVIERNYLEVLSVNSDQLTVKEESYE